MPEEFSAAFKVRYQIQICIGLEAEFEADEEWRVEALLQYLAFADCVRDFLLCDDLLFREDLHRVYAACILLSHLEYSAKSPAADELQELEIAGHQGALCLCLFVVRRKSEHRGLKQGLLLRKQIDPSRAEAVEIAEMEMLEGSEIEWITYVP